MTTFIFPGFSKENKPWLEEVAKSIKNDQVRPIYWDHWEDPRQVFDAREKAILASRHTKGEQINIIAKSIGTLVTSYVFQEIPDQVNKIILCGIPINDLNEEEIHAIEKLPSEKVTVFQNSEDPHGTYIEIKNIFPHFNIIRKEAANHSYPYFEEFKDYLIS